MFVCKAMIDARAGLCFECVHYEGENNWSSWKKTYNTFLDYIDDVYGAVNVRSVEVTWVDKGRITRPTT